MHEGKEIRGGGAGKVMEREHDILRNMRVSMPPATWTLSVQEKRKLEA